MNKRLGVLFTFIMVLCLHIDGSPSFVRSADADDALQVALLPILDVLPYHVAEANGLFKAHNVAVSAVPAASAVERDQLMQSERVDGMLTELNTTAVFNHAKVRIVIVRFARVAYPDYPLFRILAAPQSNIRTAADLAGAGIGIGKNTVIEYVTDRLLAAAGLRPEQVVKQSVPVIPERFQLLMQGRIKAAVLPDPLAKSAMTAGAVEVLADSAHPQYGVSVLAFRAATLQTRGEAVRRFLKAWDAAAAWINAHPAESKVILLNKIPIPDNVKESYQIPPFPRNGVPSQEQWTDVLRWMAERGLPQGNPAYATSVSAAFLESAPAAAPQ